MIKHSCISCQMKVLHIKIKWSFKQEAHKSNYESHDSHYVQNLFFSSLNSCLRHHENCSDQERNELAMVGKYLSSQPLSLVDFSFKIKDNFFDENQICLYICVCMLFCTQLCILYIYPHEHYRHKWQNGNKKVRVYLLIISSSK